MDIKDIKTHLAEINMEIGQYYSCGMLIVDTKNKHDHVSIKAIYRGNGKTPMTVVDRSLYELFGDLHKKMKKIDAEIEETGSPDHLYTRTYKIKKDQ